MQTATVLPGEMNGLLTSHMEVKVGGVFHLICVSCFLYPVTDRVAVHSIHHVLLVIRTAPVMARAATWWQTRQPFGRLVLKKRRFGTQRTHKDLFFSWTNTGRCRLYMDKIYYVAFNRKTTVQASNTEVENGSLLITYSGEKQSTFTFEVLVILLSVSTFCHLILWLHKDSEGNIVLFTPQHSSDRYSN